MTLRAIVIAGAGQAGFQAAASLRQEGFDGRIHLIGEEPGLPYQRPPLSKAYLKDGNSERLTFRNADFFAANRIELEDGVGVVAIDRRARRVTTGRGATLPYDHLILATGARNRPLPLEGAELADVAELRTLAHADELRRRVSAASRVVVIGGGFIGLEFAAVAHALGAGVTVFEAMPRLMARAVSHPVSEFFLEAHGAAGIDMRLNAAVARILGDGAGRAAGVELADGTRLAADLVLVAAGVAPNAEIAAAAGIDTANGVLVDAHLLTADPSVSAIGDCAAFPVDGRHVRLESVQNAVDQAKCVAARLAGRPESYRKVPWFWSDQGPWKLQMAGLTAGMDDVVVRGSPGEGRLTAFCFAGGRLVGVETVNAPGDHMAARKALGAGVPISPAMARSEGFDLRMAASAAA